MRLALAWGCTVREAQARCTSAEFSEWLAYWNIEGWGTRKDDERAARQMALLKSMHTGKGVRVADCMPPSTRTRPATQEELADKIRAAFSALVGRER